MLAHSFFSAWCCACCMVARAPCGTKNSPSPPSSSEKPLDEVAHKDVGIGMGAGQSPSIGVVLGAGKAPSIGLVLAAGKAPSIGVGLGAGKAPSIGVGLGAGKAPCIGVGLGAGKAPCIGVGKAPGIGVGKAPGIGVGNFATTPSSATSLWPSPHSNPQMRVERMGKAVRIRSGGQTNLENATTWLDDRFEFCGQIQKMEWQLFKDKQWCLGVTEG